MGIKTVLTVREAASILKISRQQLRKMIHSESITAVRIGREWRITEESIEMLLSDNVKRLGE